MERKVISKSSKRKMSTDKKAKANDFTEMVVYKYKNEKGKNCSITKHEKVK